MRSFRNLALVLVVLFATSFSQAQVVAFENVNVIPMDGERVVENQTVLVRDGKIAEVGPAGSVNVPEAATRIPAKGKYLIPGIVEMHGHLPGGPESLESLEFVEQVLFLYVANGVTTVRGMLGTKENLEHRARIEAGQLLGPKLYVAGPALNPETVPTPQDARRVVREQREAGYDHLKILGALSRDTYDAVAAAAKEFQIDLTGHVPPDVGPLHAMRAGQRSIDHLDGYVESLGPGVEAIDQGKWDTLVRTAVETGVWNVPTMGYRDTAFSNETGDALRRRLPELKYLPKSHVDGWVKQKNETVRNAEGRPLQGFSRGGKTGERMRELRIDMLRSLHQAGARIAFGTDSPQLFNVPGFSIHHEMEMMVKSGFTPYEVLETATVKPAEYFSTTEQTGTIAKGKRADLVLLNTNPLESGANVAKRAGVMLNGRWLPESEIQARLEKYAATSAAN